jgi:glutathione S-transferase
VKLYYAPGACSLASHIVLREIGRPFDLERVDLGSHRTSSGCDFMLVNPKGSVPALRLDGGRGELLTETVAILGYLADLAPEKNLAPPNITMARYRLTEMLVFLATEVHKPFAPLIHRVGSAKVESAARTRILDRLLYLQDHLGARTFLMGPQFTVADAYLFVMLQWCHRYGLDLTLFPELEAYERRVMARPSVQQALSAEGLPIAGRYAKSA